MSEEAQLNVYSHYNTTDLELESTNENTTMRFHATFGKESGTVYSKKMLVNLINNKKLTNNYNNIISNFVHEENHYCEFLEKGPTNYASTPKYERESSAIEAEINNPVWEKTDEGYRRSTMNYLGEY